MYASEDWGIGVGHDGKFFIVHEDASNPIAENISTHENAALISAAPDLFEIGVVISSLPRDLGTGCLFISEETWDALQAALDKADGSDQEDILDRLQKAAAQKEA